MMTSNQAVDYGRKIGVQFHVMNSNGGLMGGTFTIEQANAMKARCEREYSKDKLNKDLKFYVQPV